MTNETRSNKISTGCILLHQVEESCNQYNHVCRGTKVLKSDSKIDSIVFYLIDRVRGSSNFIAVNLKTRSID